MFRKKKKTEENLEITTPQTGIPAEVVAAISGAVAFLFGENATVASIMPRRQAGAGRNPWSMAGLLDNTRPF